MGTIYFGKRIKYKIGDNIYTGSVQGDPGNSEEIKVNREYVIGTSPIIDYITEDNVIEQLNKNQ